MKRTTKVVDNSWLEFIEAGKVVNGFGVTKESKVKYNRLRELWVHGNITKAQLQERIKKICNG